MKKILTLVLALVMTMSLVTVSAGAKDFTDSSKINYDEAVAVMSAVKVIDGYAEGDFRPSTTLTRGAAAKIICNLILGPITASALVADAAPYKDVPTNHTFAGYIAYCQKTGIISGYADGTFKPANSLTGYAFMKMLLGALGYKAEQEGYTGPNWSIQVAKRAMNIGLKDGLIGDFNGVKAVTREEACLYAFNTLQATMVEYNKNSTVTVGNITIKEQSDAKEMANTAKTETIKDDNKMQFAEKYFEDLKLEKGSDDFGRPANKWTYDKKDIGTYVNYDLLVSEYTTKVKGGDVYSDIGSTAADYDLTYWVDGVKETDAKKIKAQSSQIAKKNDDTMFTSGKGALTQIFVDNDDEDLTIVEINTYLAKTDDYNEKKETLKFDKIYGYGSVDDVELDDIASIKDYKDGDMVLLTIADGEVKTITPAETVKNVELDEFSRKDVDAYVVTGKTQYDFAKTGKASYSLGNDVLTAYDDNNLDDTTYNLYLDSYGYLIGIEKVDDDDQYVFITAYEKYSSYLTSKLTDANAIFADGTQKTIKVDLKKSFENTYVDTNKEVKPIYGGWEKDGARNVNLWFKYTVKDENTYRLELATKQFHDDRDDTKNDIVMTIDSKHPAQKATVIPANTDPKKQNNFFYGNADTTYITVNVDEMGGDVVIDDVDNVTTGIKNVSIDVYSIAKAKKEAKASSATNVSHGIYTVYDGGYAVASIVIGDDGATSDKFAFLYGAAKKESYNKSEKLYTWVMDAIVGGEKTTITFKSELPSTMTDAAEAGDLYKVSYNKDGYATEATPAQYDSDYVWVDDYAKDPTKKDIVKTTFGTSSQPKVDLTADGDTLWITEQGNNRGIVLADNCPAVIVEQKTSSGNEVDKVVEYASVAKAIKALDNYDSKTDGVKNFDGTIIVMLKDGIATSVILTDTVEKVDHKKEDTVAGVTASLKTSADGKGLTLHVTGMTTETVTYKVIATDIRSQNSAVVKTGDIKAEYTKVVDVTDSTMSYAVEVTVDGKTMTVSL